VFDCPNIIALKLHSVLPLGPPHSYRSRSRVLSYLSHGDPDSTQFCVNPSRPGGVGSSLGLICNSDLAFQFENPSQTVPPRHPPEVASSDMLIPLQSRDTAVHMSNLQHSRGRLNLAGKGLGTPSQINKTSAMPNIGDDYW